MKVMIYNICCVQDTFVLTLLWFSYPFKENVVLVMVFYQELFYSPGEKLIHCMQWFSKNLGINSLGQRKDDLVAMKTRWQGDFFLKFLKFWALWIYYHEWKWRNESISCLHVRLFATPWTVTHQAPLSMDFSRQEYWSG